MEVRAVRVESKVESAMSHIAKLQKELAGVRAEHPTSQAALVASQAEVSKARADGTNTKEKLASALLDADEVVQESNYLIGSAMCFLKEYTAARTAIMFNFYDSFDLLAALDAGRAEFQEVGNATVEAVISGIKLNEVDQTGGAEATGGAAKRNEGRVNGTEDGPSANVIEQVRHTQ